jgi:Outer membrane protein beta-barrel domain
MIEVGSMKRAFANMRRMKPVALALCAAASATAVAEDDDGADEGEQRPQRFYAGLGIANLEHEVDHEGIEFSDDSVGLDAFAGFRLSDRLDVEIAYKRFDGIEARDIAGSGVDRLDIEMPLDVVVIKAIASVSLRELLAWQRDWRLYGSAGAYRTDSDRTVTTLADGATETIEHHESGLTVGGGVLYRVGPVDLRGYVEWFGVLDEAEAWDAGVAVQFNF